jgi:hypothetical protein
MPQRARGRNATVFEHSSQARQFSDKFPRSFCAFSIGTPKKQYVSVLLRISNEIAIAPSLSNKLPPMDSLSQMQNLPRFMATIQPWSKFVLQTKESFA